MAANFPYNLNFTAILMLCFLKGDFHLFMTSFISYLCLLQQLYVVYEYEVEYMPLCISCHGYLWQLFIVKIWFFLHYSHAQLSEGEIFIIFECAVAAFGYNNCMSYMTMRLFASHVIDTCDCSFSLKSEFSMLTFLEGKIKYFSLVLSLAFGC